MLMKKTVDMQYSEKCPSMKCKVCGQIFFKNHKRIEIEMSTCPQCLGKSHE